MSPDWIGWISPDRSISRSPSGDNKYMAEILRECTHNTTILQAGEEDTVIGTTPKMICHVFESEEVPHFCFLTYFTSCNEGEKVDIFQPIHKCYLTNRVA